jgi:hypothetical protein
MATPPIGRVGVLWRGDRAARAAARPETSRFARIFEALARRDIDAEPVVFAEEMAEEVRAQLLTLDGVLVWVDPLSDGRTRAVLDRILREVAERGTWVSSHPDVILKLGVKEVLHRTRHLGWGTDTHLYRAVEILRAEFPDRLRSDGPRVLKRNRGNGGQGVWKVEWLSDRDVRVLEARRGSVPEDIALGDFMTRCEPYFEDGAVIDQPFQPRLPDGMIRCYMAGGRVAGFGHQFIKALIAPPTEGPESAAAQPGPRLMHPSTAPQFQRLRSLIEGDWCPGAMQCLGLGPHDLPIIWDADFLYGCRTAAGEDTYVLCEINVSSVFPIPDQAPDAIARAVEARLRPGH